LTDETTNITDDILLFSFCGQTGKRTESSSITANSDCDLVKKNFNKKLKEITWDKEQNGDKLVTDDFFNKYLRNIKEFKTRNEYIDFYYHSIPDIQTDKCLVIIKSVFKFDQYSYSYNLVDMGQRPRVIFELAALENYPDGQRRIKSIFLNNKNLRQTKVTEYLGDYDDKADKYEVITDSLTLYFRIENNDFILTKRDSIRSSKK